jgi:uncharacterized protein
MKSLKKFAFRILLLLSGLYILFLILIYFFQEKILFHPVALPKDYLSADLPPYIEEKFITVDDGVQLHGLLFKSEQSKGLVFYLHGNGGDVFSWGESTAQMITDLGYDLFIPDYRGYGKSTGTITSEAQLHSDIDKVYAEITKEYNQKDIVIAGYSIGTGLATHLAMGKNIKALILEAPYYSLANLSDEKVPLIPDFTKKYTIRTNEWIGKVQVPVYLFHGTQDALIPYAHAEKLSAENKALQLIPVEGTDHNGINNSAIFAEKLEEILR